MISHTAVYVIENTVYLFRISLECILFPRMYPLLSAIHVIENIVYLLRIKT